MESSKIYLISDFIYQVTIQKYTDRSVNNTRPVGQKIPTGRPTYPELSAKNPTDSPKNHDQSGKKSRVVGQEIPTGRLTNPDRSAIDFLPTITD